MFLDNQHLMSSAHVLGPWMEWWVWEVWSVYVIVINITIIIIVIITIINFLHRVGWGFSDNTWLGSIQSSKDAKYFITRASRDGRMDRVTFPQFLYDEDRVVHLLPWRLCQPRAVRSYYDILQKLLWNLNWNRILKHFYGRIN